MSMNCYPEAVEDGSGKVASALYPTEGAVAFVQLSDTPVRGQLYSNGREFAVGGSIFSEVFSDGTKTDRGVIATDGMPVSMAAGITQILIASAGTGYVFDLTANTLTAIPPSTLTGINQVGYCDGFFIAVLNNSETFQASNLLDATTWNPLSTTTINVFVGKVLSILVDHDIIWLHGDQRSTAYYDAGTSPFPFALVPGANIEQGIVAKNSRVQLDNSIFWIGGDSRGAGIAWRAVGYTPTRVSNHAVEYAWQNYPRIDDAVAYSYQSNGHSFWVIYFPTANKTWVYDVATSMWHERGYWNEANGIFTAHHSQNHVFAFGKHLVGDWASGTIYQLSGNFYTDSGNPIRRVRRAPHVSTEQEWIFHHQLQLDMETGLGPQPPLTGPSDSPWQIVVADTENNLWSVQIADNGTPQDAQPVITGSAEIIIINDNVLANTSWQIGVNGNPLSPDYGKLIVIPVPYDASEGQSFPMATTPGFLQSALFVGNGHLQTNTGATAARDPMVNLRWSDDGGHTWSNYYAVGAGQAGNFKTRCMWRRLGRSRDRVYEFSMTDPIPWRLLDADLKASPGFQSSERLVSQYRKVS